MRDQRGTPSTRRAPVRLSRLVAAALVAAALVGSAVSVTVASGGTRTPDAHAARAASAPLLRVGFTNLEFSTLDPAAGTSVYLDSFGLELLMKLTPNGHLAPSLAVSVANPNPTTYVYHLRRGVKFWDGSELTSADVVNSLNYERLPRFQSAQAFTDVKSIAPAGRYAVVVKLKHADAGWQYVPASSFAYIFEKRFQDAHKTSMGKPGVLIMGTGPWKFDSVDPTKGAELSANPNWWGGKVPFQHITVTLFADETSEALAFRAGQLDVAFPAGASTFAATAKTKLLSLPSCNQYYLSLPTQTAPWNDVHVRRAVAYAINHPDVAVAAAGAYATPDYTLIPPVQLRSVASQAQVAGLLRSLPTYQFSVARAKAELAKSAYPHGFSADFVTFQYGNYVNTVQAIAGDLAKIGIKLNVKVLSVGALVNVLNGPIKNIGLQYNNTGCLTPDIGLGPEILLDSKNAHAAGSNYANYVNPSVDGLLTAGAGTSVDAKRFAMYSKILRTAGSDVPYVPLYTLNTVAAVAPRFSWSDFNPYSSSTIPWALGLKAR